MMGSALTDVERTVQELADRAELIDLEIRKGLYADENRIDDLGDIRTEDSVSLQRDGALAIEGLKAIQTQAHKTLSLFDRVQHLITNILVDVDGDTAKIRANVLATHMYADEPDAVWVIKGYYTDEARRTPEGWRLTQTALHRVWEHDSREASATGR